MDELLASIRPINPSAFGGLPQEQAPQQGNQSFDANQYLMQKVMEIRQKMNQGEQHEIWSIKFYPQRNKY